MEHGITVLQWASRTWALCPMLREAGVASGVLRRCLLFAKASGRHCFRNSRDFGLLLRLLAVTTGPTRNSSRYDYYYISCLTLGAALLKQQCTGIILSSAPPYWYFIVLYYKSLHYCCHAGLICLCRQASDSSLQPNCACPCCIVGAMASGTESDSDDSDIRWLRSLCRWAHNLISIAQESATYANQF